MSNSGERLDFLFTLQRYWEFAESNLPEGVGVTSGTQSPVSVCMKKGKLRKSKSMNTKKWGFPSVGRSQAGGFVSYTQKQGHSLTLEKQPQTWVRLKRTQPANCVALVCVFRTELGFQHSLSTWLRDIHLLGPILSFPGSALCIPSIHH